MKKYMLCAVLLCCFACQHNQNSTEKTTEQSISIEQQPFDCVDKVIHYEEVPFLLEETGNIDTDKCFFSSESDCGGGEFVFLNEKDVIYSFFCCCSTVAYRRGTYTANPTEVICKFVTDEIYGESEDDGKTYSITTNKKEPLTFQLKINYCKNNKIYLYERVQEDSFSTYGTYSGRSVEAAINQMKEEGAWTYLNKGTN
jgi:hypothetical protein